MCNHKAIGEIMSDYKIEYLDDHDPVQEYSFKVLGQTVEIYASSRSVFITMQNGESWTTLEHAVYGSPSDPAIPYDKHWLSGAAAQSHRNKQLKEYAEEAILRKIHDKCEEI